MGHVDPLVTKEPATIQADTEDSARIGMVAVGFAVCALITLLIAAVYHHKIARIEVPPVVTTTAEMAGTR